MRQVSQSKLARLTGSRMPREQADIIRSIGVVPLVRADGSVCVLEEALLAAMLVPRKSAAFEPDWSVFDTGRAG